MNRTGHRSRPGQHLRDASRGAVARIPRGIASADDRGRVAVVGASVGQGYDGAARELARRLAASGVGVTVHDYLDALPAAARLALRDLYAPTVLYLPAVFDGLFRRLERPGPLRRLARFTSALARPEMARWAASADVVVSTYPLAGQTLGDLRRDGLVSGTSITYLTDPAAHVLWCHPDVDPHLTVTRASARDAAGYGVTAEVAGPSAPRGSATPSAAEPCGPSWAAPAARKHLVGRRADRPRHRRPARRPPPDSRHRRSPSARRRSCSVRRPCSRAAWRPRWCR